MTWASQLLGNSTVRSPLACADAAVAIAMHVMTRTGPVTAAAYARASRTVIGPLPAAFTGDQRIPAPALRVSLRIESAVARGPGGIAGGAAGTWHTACRGPWARPSTHRCHRHSWLRPQLLPHALEGEMVPTWTRKASSPRVQHRGQRLPPRPPRPSPPRELGQPSSSTHPKGCPTVLGGRRTPAWSGKSLGCFVHALAPPRGHVKGQPAPERPRQGRWLPRTGCPPSSAR